MENMQKRKLALRFLFLIFFTFSALAEERVADEQALPWSLSLYFENDLFGETDQNYTNGVRFSWVSPDVSSYETDPILPRWLRDINDGLHFFHDRSLLKRCSDRRRAHKNDDCLSRNLVVSLGQLIYTPEDIDSTAVVENQRPYAGYLYGSVGYHTRSDNLLDTIEFTLGIVGSASFGQETQDLIHDLRGFDKFRGWGNQLENELGLGVLYEHKRRMFRSPLAVFHTDTGLQHDFIAHGGLSLGNVSSYVNIGFEYRVGWYLPDDFGTASIRPGGDNSSPGRSDPRLRPDFIRGLHLFLSTDARWVGRDIFLDGNNFKDSHSVDKEHTVADIALGINFIIGRWKLSYAQVWRSREFKQQVRSHEYGSMTLSYIF